MSKANDSQCDKYQGSAALFHGITGSPDEMKELADMLQSRGFFVEVPALSGHGSLDELKKTRMSAWLEDAERGFRAIEEKSKRRFLIGLSFGALLSLATALKRPNQISALVLMSLPLRFKKFHQEVLLSLLSYLPDERLDTFGLLKKTAREDGIFLRERRAFDYHSIAAGARLMRLRQHVLLELGNLDCPVLLLQDPEDHHLSSKVPEIFLAAAPRAKVEVACYSGAQHEMTIGHRSPEIFARIAEFLQSVKG